MTTRTWVTSYNNVPAQTTLDAQAKAIIYALKSHMVDAGYIVDYSCNSSIAGTAGDLVDRWVSSADLRWGNNGGGSPTAHSWVVLRRPVGHLPNSKVTYILLSCGTATSGTQDTIQQRVLVTVSSSAFSGGSTTADPTATSANRIQYASNVGVQFIRTPVVNSKYHMVRSDAGDWAFMVSPDGTNRVIGAFGSFISGSATYESGINYPCLDFASYLDSGTGGFSASTLSSVPASAAMFHTDGTAAASTAGIATPMINGSSTLATFTSSGSSITGRYPLVPVLIGTFSSTIAFKGTLVDIYLAPTGTGVVQGTETPGTGASEYAIMGEFWVPNGGVAPQL